MILIDNIFKNVKKYNNSFIENFKYIYFSIIQIYFLIIQEISQYSSITITITFLTENQNQNQIHNFENNEMNEIVIDNYHRSLNNNNHHHHHHHSIINTDELINKQQQQHTNNTNNTNIKSNSINNFI